jgi:hypothetical protein
MHHRLTAKFVDTSDGSAAASASGSYDRRSTAGLVDRKQKISSVIRT